MKLPDSAHNGVLHALTNPYDCLNDREVQVLAFHAALSLQQGLYDLLVVF